MAASSPRVVVADDDADIVHLICEALEMKGYSPCATFNGVQALAEVDRDPPALVILDVMMPVMDGLEALAQLRQNPETKDVPVLLLTALSADKDVARGILAGATMYLTKPLHVAELIRLVSVLTKRGPQLAAG